jgi:hypothetical protein
MFTVRNERSRAMSRTKPVTGEEAIAIVEKRRRRARAHYARMRDDARRYRETQQGGESLPAANEPPTK